MEFPQFRKLENGKSLYQILSPTQFIEWQQIGSTWHRYEFEVRQFPDLVRLQEMLQANRPFERLPEIEFQALLATL
jgi:hypothetical protein